VHRYEKLENATGRLDIGIGGMYRPLHLARARDARRLPLNRAAARITIAITAGNR
jgi:hypothetical protein